MKKSTIIFLICFPLIHCSEKSENKQKKLKRSHSFGTLDIKINRAPSVFIEKIIEEDGECNSWDTILWQGCNESNISKCILALENGANPNFYKKQKTPLHIACKNQNFDIVRLLLKANANIDIKNKHHNTPFEIALETKNDSIMQLFSDYEYRQNKLMIQSTSLTNAFTQSSEGGYSTAKDQKKFLAYIKKIKFKKATSISEKHSFYWEQEILKSQKITRMNKNSYLKYALKIALDRYKLSNGLQKTQRAIEYIKQGVIWHSSKKQIPINLKSSKHITQNIYYNLIQYLIKSNCSNQIMLSILRNGFEYHPDLVLDGLNEILFFKIKNSKNFNSIKPLVWIQKNKHNLFECIIAYIQEYCSQELIEQYLDEKLIALL